MPGVNLTARRRDVKRIIDDDPWTIVVRTPGRTPEDGETTHTFTGRLQPQGGRGMMDFDPRYMQGEHSLTRFAWAILAEWDITAVKGGDEVVATHDATSIVKTLQVFHADQYPYKWEIQLDDRQR